MSNLQSSGRGGAGNIVDKKNTTPLQPEDLQTPTLKTNVVTTGRGGTGNMAKNLDPVEARLRQDVEPVIRRDSKGASHIGRGGTGNVFNPEDAEKAKKEAEKSGSAVADDAEKEKTSWTEKGKAFLFGKK
ncbi:hypothetical protein V8F20_000714 [Naviculisporaceae sp. PSN 640]